LIYLLNKIKTKIKQNKNKKIKADKTGDIINKIKEAGMKVGVAIKPHTPVEWIIPYADKIDMVLVMTVEPGFGSQKLIESCLSKVFYIYINIFNLFL